jgi:hypothetical protein
LPVSVRRANDVPGGFATRDLTWTGTWTGTWTCKTGPNCAVRDSSNRFLSDRPGVANAAFRKESVPKTTIHAAAIPCRYAGGAMAALCGFGLSENCKDRRAMTPAAALVS